jgi:hypothetical protein
VATIATIGRPYVIDRFWGSTDTAIARVARGALSGETLEDSPDMTGFARYVPVRSFQGKPGTEAVKIRSRCVGVKPAYPFGVATVEGDVDMFPGERIVSGAVIKLCFQPRALLVAVGTGRAQSTLVRVVALVACVA